MPNNSRERNTALGQAALIYLDQRGITALPIARVHCAAFAEAQSCTVETARRHLVRALNFTQRGKEAIPPGWGGMRSYQPGRPRKEKNEHPK